jgi:hypothetical protein
MAPKKKTNKKTTARKPKASTRTTKTSAHKKTVQKKRTPKASRSVKRVASSQNASRKRTRTKRQKLESKFSAQGKEQMLVGEADSQGLSNVEQADSESVRELVDEGNIFEAGAVMGIEEAEDADQREVHTRELPEDDVPEEYLDKD